MFQFTQEPSSGSSPVLSLNYRYGFSVLVGIDAVMLWQHISLLCRHNIDYIYTDEHR